MEAVDAFRQRCQDEDEADRLALRPERRAMMFARAFFTGVVIAAVLITFAMATGRAFDHEAQQRVIFTKHGRTLDCNRAEGADGRVFYDHCVTVP